MNSEKPKLEEIKYLGRVFAPNAWGNSDAEKVIQWYCDRLEEEMKKNCLLDIENFILRK